MLFLLLPKFFNFDNKNTIIKDYLLENYKLSITDYDHIKYNIFPKPNLSINSVNLTIYNKPIFLKTGELKLFLHIGNFYNFKKLRINKILLKDSDMSLNIDDGKLKPLNFFKF